MEDFKFIGLCSGEQKFLIYLDKDQFLEISN